jgi:ABC-type multidrug transport system fused ATPase/permease subunit
MAVRVVGDFDLDVRPGERVAVVGPHGCGKTTLFETVCGLRDPRRGTIETDGIDIRSLSLGHLRDQIGFVERADVFQGTAGENLRVGRADVSLTDIREALEAVGLVDAVHNLPQGLDTLLTPNGGPLSAGQAVRLTIARALAGRPRLLILDGVLDMLDLRECPQLLSRLFDRTAPWTLLVTSADLTIVKMCDRVIELNRTVGTTP